MSSVIIFGGYGVFGSLIAQELVSRGLSVTIAGRQESKGQKLKEKLGQGVQVQIADVKNRHSTLSALHAHSIAVHCAGPFHENETTLLEACLERGCHYLDISDDRTYIARVRGLHEDFLEKGLSAVYGASSLPGISGALASMLAQERKDPPQEIRVVLFIGNRNPKGEAAFESVFKIFGKSISAPQGILRGMRDQEWVDLPPPFGRRPAFNFESPEYDLFPEQFQAASVRVKVSFEWKAAGLLLSFLSHLPRRVSSLFKGPLLKMGNGMSAWGSSGGVLQVSFSYPDGSSSSVSLLAEEQGQRMAILPAVFAVLQLLKNTPRSGVSSAYEFLGNRLLQGLRETGNIRIHEKRAHFPNH
jgi:hypothetical protein